ncbi:hypothetical protein QZH41_002065 [Actinostola sp. cb2023]|nr:hypothetical protein QZH41_002065 [Actinostola sp. cb2023]
MRSESWCFGGVRVRILVLYLAVSIQLILYEHSVAFTATSAATAKLSNELGIRLYELLSREENGNILFSPLGMTLALGVVRLGARGSVAKDMDRIIQWSPRTIHRQLKVLRSQVTVGRNDDVDLEIRNLLFGDSNIGRLRAKFRKIIKYYSAKTKLVKSSQIMNHFKNHAQADLWQMLVKEDTVFVSRVKLNAHWEIPFCVFKRSSFNLHRHDGSPDKAVQAYYMGLISDENKWNYLDDEENKCQVIEMNYGKERVGDMWDPRYNPADISMVIALPYKDYPLRNLEEHLTIHNVYNWLSRTRPTNIDVSIPRFNLSRVMDGAHLLRKLGIQDSPLNLKTDSRKYGNVRSVWQESSLAASETGTNSEYPPEVLSIVLLSKPKKTFFVDRPFLFLVRDKVTNSILFFGRVVNPNTD